MSRGSTMARKQYYDRREESGRISDIADVVGITYPNETGIPEGNYDWKTVVNPELLFEAAQLANFCYADRDRVEVGLVDPYVNPTNTPPMIAIGDMTEDHHVYLCSRRDEDSPLVESHEQTTLGGRE